MMGVGPVMIALPAGDEKVPPGAVPSAIVGWTVSSVVPSIPFRMALMVAVPAAAAVATPVAGLIVAAPESLLQVASPARLWLVPSVSTPVAVNATVSPTSAIGFAGATTIDASSGDRKSTRLNSSHGYIS